MAKEQKRGNREAKKPKAIKKPEAAAPAALLKGSMAPLAGGKRKG